jgi:hypothetical protein
VVEACCLSLCQGGSLHVEGEEMKSTFTSRRELRVKIEVGLLSICIATTSQAEAVLTTSRLLMRRNAQASLRSPRSSVAGEPPCKSRAEHKRIRDSQGELQLARRRLCSKSW